MSDRREFAGKGLALGARGIVAAALAFTALGLAAAPASAATVVVNTTVDQATGSCATTCSLRDAVATANPGDTVQIPAGHYVLTLGNITLTKSLTLAGSGARTTVIDGNNTLVGSGGIFFLVNVAGTFEIDDLSLINGSVVNGGGAMLAQGAFVSPPTLTLRLRRCTVANNQSRVRGGGMDLNSLALDIEECTFSNNSAGGFAGGGVNLKLGTASVVNSTFSGNRSGFGMGLDISQATSATLTNNTITANQATSGSNPALVIGATQVTLSNNIIAENVGRDCGIPVTTVTDHNLDSDNSCHLTGPGDLPGVNPLLGPLADNGGPTDTSALLAGSPAIDAGNNATCPATDQRGVIRPQGPACDIGAYELIQPPDCSHAVASPDLLWPPNHKFVPIQITGVTNPDGGALTIDVTSIFQDEPVGSGKHGCDGEDDDHGDQALFPLIFPRDDGGDGDKRVDGKGVGTATAAVRAERSCKGDGRVYHISFTATNGQGLSCMGAVTVGVARHKNVPPVDGGALYDSTKPAPHDHHDD
ncbi:MAG TPA: choice-of-anchor Q domain-containing protein [Thermoanaerobaculia bacterium]|nr:choice-of-anchor Q domain-containing protein [Thermoanaerobaculia bacterium]